MTSAKPFIRHCPICGYRLTSSDPLTERVEHDKKYHPAYWAVQSGLVSKDDKIAIVRAFKEMTRGTMDGMQ